MKRVLILVLLMCSLAAAKTDIFGDDRNFSVYFGDDFACADFGFTPVDRFDWGVRYAQSYNEVKENHLKVDEHFIGPWCKYPFLAFEGVFKPFPLEGQAYAGCSVLYHLGTNTDLYFTPKVGLDVKVTDNVYGRIAYQYCKRESMFGDKSKVLAGCTLRW